MKSLIAATTVFVGLGAVTSGAAFWAPADPFAPAASGWRPSYVEAQAAAREAGKPILLVFR